jgi:hypothetical protein
MGALIAGARQWSERVLKCPPPGIGIARIADIDAHQMIVTAVLAAKSSTETPRNARSEAMNNFPQPSLYSSWRRHQTPVSLRPLGARSSHWYMPQRPSSPRAYVE